MDPMYPKNPKTPPKWRHFEDPDPYKFKPFHWRIQDSQGKIPIVTWKMFGTHHFHPFYDWLFGVPPAGFFHHSLPRGRALLPNLQHRHLQHVGGRSDRRCAWGMSTVGSVLKQDRKWMWAVIKALVIIYLGGGFIVFYVHPENCGTDPIWWAIFSDSLKPPTRYFM